MRDPLASAFSKHAWEAYVESPQLPALTLDAHLPQQLAWRIFAINTRRFRRNALLHSAHPLPLFCVLDSIGSAAEHMLDDLQ